jgi:hypothetical protein
MDEHATHGTTENTLDNTTNSNIAAENLRSRMLHWDQDDRARIHINKDGVVEMKIE